MVKPRYTTVRKHPRTTLINKKFVIKHLRNLKPLGIKSIVLLSKKIELNKLKKLNNNINLVLDKWDIYLSREDPVEFILNEEGDTGDYTQSIIDRRGEEFYPLVTKELIKLGLSDEDSEELTIKIFDDFDDKKIGKLIKLSEKAEMDFQKEQDL